MSGNDNGAAVLGVQERPEGLIQHYESIARASRNMLEAAHQGDWDSVERIEEQCRTMIAALKRAAQSEALSPPERARRVALLRAILQDDAQIRLRAEPWLRELEEMFASARQAGRRAR